LFLVFKYYYAAVLIARITDSARRSLCPSVCPSRTNSWLENKKNV